VHIRYTRQDALQEGAVLPIEYRVWDGLATYNYREKRHEMRLSDADGRDVGRVLKTCLTERGDDGYIAMLLRDAMDDWAQYRRDVYRSKAIVICVSQDMARWVHRYLEEDLGESPMLAISDEKTLAASRIKSFRKSPESSVLVTVGMAYEGLDVPAATHLVLLTNIRAEPWLQQAVARVTRINPSCPLKAHQQLAYVYGPDDLNLRKFFDNLLVEDDTATPVRESQRQASELPLRASTFEALDAEATCRGEGSDIGGRLPRHVEVAVQQCREKLPLLRHLSGREILIALRQMREMANELDLDLLMRPDHG
jgi:superfamily II DNA or RNA helicase